MRPFLREPREGQPQQSLRHLLGRRRALLRASGLQAGLEEAAIDCPGPGVTRATRVERESRSAV